MKDICFKEKTINNKVHVLFSLFLSIAYFLYLYEFYSNDYYPYDMFNYAGMWDRALANGQMAYDGFSSLFLIIAKWGYNFWGFNVFTPIILGINALSVFLFCWVSGKIIKTLFNRIIFITFFISTGYLYYLYGKLLYEWPFTLFNTVLTIIFLFYWIQKNSKICKVCTWILMGLLLSWKPSNVFIVFPICFWVVFFFTKTDMYIGNIMQDAKKYCYNFLLYSLKLLQGI